MAQPPTSDTKLLDYDRERGLRLIAGADEVGRACWAGPIMAAGVLFDLERLTHGPGRELAEQLNDSKRLSRRKRERLAPSILAHAEAVAIVTVPASEIDRLGTDAANVICLSRALRGLGERPELRLVDGILELDEDAPAHELLVHGDATSATVAAASIVAKVARDRVMVRLGESYPGYGFERHAAYGTDAHKAAIRKLGLTRQHRLSVKADCVVEALASGRDVRGHSSP